MTHPEADICVPLAPGTELKGILHVPKPSSGLILFVHGSGSSRLSPRNREVAATLNMNGLATLLIDLLTPAEENVDAFTAKLRFDIPMLTRRVVGIVQWLENQPSLSELSLGLFGASTGAAAALQAAAACPGRIKAVVSRGGRPDLAGDALEAVRAPTLLIVGGDDREVLKLNRAAMARMSAETHLHIVAAATHLFEEPGALAEVAQQAVAWFRGHL